MGSEHLVDVLVAEIIRVDHFCVLQGLPQHLAVALHKDNLVVLPHALDGLVRGEIGLLALTVSQVIFPETFEQ